VSDKHLEYLKEYNGRELKLMEVCGSHTAAIAKTGIKQVISEKIRLVSGPGCPVCVCPSSYTDKLIRLASEGKTILSFGDLIRVPGSKGSLNEAKGRGGDVRMLYSPMDSIELALREPEKSFVFAAVGFETTIPAYALLLDEIIEKGIKNLKLLTALKCMIPVIEELCRAGSRLDGFIAPGHVSVIIGANAYRKVSKEYDMPFAVTGFKDKELIDGIYGLVRLCENKESLRNTKQGLVRNFYGGAVEENGNKKALKKINEYFEFGDTVWRGMGEVKDSGLYLKERYMEYDAGSRFLREDEKADARCSCDKVLTGKLTPQECPLFLRECTLETPRGACMVSQEGSCYQSCINRI